MKIVFTVGISMLLMLPVFSQQTIKPSGQPGKRPLPTPHIIPFTPDLLVTAISYVSGGLSPAGDKYIITVQLSIKNNGSGNSGACKLSARYQRESTHGYYSAGADNVIIIPVIAAGATVTGNYTFQIMRSNLGAGTYSFPFKVFIDSEAQVKESDETNNMSGEITITVHL